MPFLQMAQDSDELGALGLFLNKNRERLRLDVLCRVSVAIGLFTELANALFDIDVGQDRARKGV